MKQNAKNYDKMSLAQRQASMAKDLSTIDQSMAIILMSVGNPDFQQYAPLSPARLVVVNTLREAVEASYQYIGEFNLGGGNWEPAVVYHPVRGEIAWISYNLRVWKGSYDADTMPDEWPESEMDKTWEEL